MATLNISITKEELKKCKEIIETLVTWLISEHKGDVEATRAIVNAYGDLVKLLKLNDAE